MIRYNRFTLHGVLAICFAGLLLCVPNFIRQAPYHLPWSQVHLGLDLQGGSYLLLQVNTETLSNDRLTALEDDIKHNLTDAGLGYRQFSIDAKTRTLRFYPRDEHEADAAFKVVNDLPRASPDEFSVQRAQARIEVALNHQVLQRRAHEAMAQTIEIVRRRIDGTGAVDPQITRQGEDRIVVELPGVSDPERIKALLGTTAKMTFQLVATAGSAGNVGGITMVPAADNSRQWPVLNHVEVDGAALTNAAPVIDQQTGQWAVSFSFDHRGATAFAKTTTENVGKMFAIILDNKVIEAPVIRTPITGGNGQITGNFDARTATDLALMLRAGALPVPLNVVEQRSIGPSLGVDSIRAGAISLLVGLLLVIVFMQLFYGLFGLYANLALLANLVLMIAILSLFQATLTLPGMAGMLLTLGMAVDANILINERIREEVRNGRTALAALQNGFERAQSTIVDSNATAFLAHVMLFAFGTGPVRGFALTITIGILTTLFTTMVLSRLLIVRWYAKTRPATLPV